MSNLTKREIVLEIYRKSGFPQKQIVDTVQQTLDIIQKALANGRNVELRNFGVLEVQVELLAITLHLANRFWTQHCSHRIKYLFPKKNGQRK